MLKIFCAFKQEGLNIQIVFRPVHDALKWIRCSWCLFFVPLTKMWHNFWRIFNDKWREFKFWVLTVRVWVVNEPKTFSFVLRLFSIIFQNLSAVYNHISTFVILFNQQFSQTIIYFQIKERSSPSKTINTIQVLTIRGLVLWSQSINKSTSHTQRLLIHQF